MKYFDIALMLAVTLAGIAYASTNGAGGGSVAGMFILGLITIAMTFGQKSRKP